MHYLPSTLLSKMRQKEGKSMDLLPYIKLTISAKGLVNNVAV
jgi:hypothetical protein